MTKYSAQKKAARAYQRLRPGTRFAAALAAVTTRGAGRPGWQVGYAPAIRRRRKEASCYFCGRDTAIASFTDMTDDPGRVAVYCDNSDCDAREFEVVIVDDGTAATRNRTDVRILAHFPPQFVDPLWAGPGEDWAAGTPPFARTRGGLVDCMFCGERSCRLSQGDIAHDDGRIRLCCSNNHCQVGEVEVLVMRDEVRSLGEERPDVKALNALFVSRADRLAAELPPGAPRIFAFADFAAPADGVDPLAMRISGPVPWDGG